MKCPCENCICLPVCKHKKYEDLFDECSLVKKYIPQYKWVGSRTKNIRIVKNILNPTTWYLRPKTNDQDYVISKGRFI